jgi:hypothetical protein
MIDLSSLALSQGEKALSPASSTTSRSPWGCAKAFRVEPQFEFEPNILFITIQFHWSASACIG